MKLTRPIQDRAQADQACQAQFGTAYVAKFDATDNPVGCELSNANRMHLTASVREGREVLADQRR